MRNTLRGAWSWALVVLVPVCVGGLSAVLSGARSSRRQAAAVAQSIVPLAAAPVALISSIDSSAQWSLGSSKAQIVIRVVAPAVCASCESTLLGVEDVTALFGGSVQARLLLIDREESPALNVTRSQPGAQRLRDGGWLPYSGATRRVPDLGVFRRDADSAGLNESALVMIDGDMLPTAAAPRFLLERLRVHLLALPSPDSTRPIRTFHFR